jgi:hypothetical protein
LTELLINLLRCRDLPCLQTRLCDSGLLFFNNLSTKIDTLVTYIDTSRTSDKALNLILTLTTERAAVSGSHIFRICHVCNLSLKGLSVYSTSAHPYFRASRSNYSISSVWADSSSLVISTSPVSPSERTG